MGASYRTEKILQKTIKIYKMSIKTIDRDIQGQEGVKKKINKGAEKLVFDIL